MEVSKLRAENARLKMEKEILKNRLRGLDHASWKQRKTIAAALRPIYTAATAEAAREALEEFASSPWGEKYPTIVQPWRRAWENVIPFFAFPPEVRRVIYTTNIVESLTTHVP